MMSIANKNRSRKYMFSEMCQGLIITQGDNFNLNEFPYKYDDHVVFMDFDGMLTDSKLSTIEVALSELTGGKLELLIATKPTTGRVHIRTNIVSWLNHKDILTYLKQYLREFLARDDFDNMFDTRAMGLNSIYSCKFKDGVLLPEFYVPIGEPMVRPDAQIMIENLWRYSIYNTKGSVEFLPEIITDIQQVAAEVAANAKAKETKEAFDWAAQDDFYAAGKLAMFDGKYPHV